MLDVVENFLLKYSITNKTVIVAFSGGPDSVALTLLLNQLKDILNLNIVLCYFNHGWRKEAYLEEEFTKEIACRYNFDYIIGSVPENIKKNEETARLYRYNFLEKCADKYATNVVLLAHNKNDNVETLIYRVIKGTSIKGLCSIPENRDIFFRPLLNVSKDDILKFLNKNNQNYMVDSSNLDSKYKRNLIRNEILPLFSKINPNYIDNISNLIENSINTKTILDNVINSNFESIINKNGILRSEFIKLPPEIRFEIINKFLFNELKNRDKKTILKIDEFILKNCNSCISINSKKHLFVKNNLIFLDKICKNFTDLECLKIEKPGNYIFKNIELNITESKLPDKFPKSSDNICYMNILFPLYLRTRRKGDIFSPFGLDGTMKLKEFFINNKIPCNIRDKIILLSYENEICWILGYKLSEKCRVTGNECYKLEYRRINDDC